MSYQSVSEKVLEMSHLNFNIFHGFWYNNETPHLPRDVRLPAVVPTPRGNETPKLKIFSWRKVEQSILLTPRNDKSVSICNTPACTINFRKYPRSATQSTANVARRSTSLGRANYSSRWSFRQTDLSIVNIAHFARLSFVNYVCFSVGGSSNLLIDVPCPKQKFIESDSHFYPQIRGFADKVAYPEFDFTVFNPRTLPLISRILGGADHPRYDLSQY